MTANCPIASRRRSGPPLWPARARIDVALTINIGTSMIEQRVLIAGAGPVGLVAAAQLVKHGVPVTVFEAGSQLASESRASTFHPPTLDMLEDLGVARGLIGEGLKAPQLQYRSKKDGVIAQFDFGEIADQTGHPYRVQSEQF